MRRPFGHSLKDRPSIEAEMTAWERFCHQSGLDPLQADPATVGFRGIVATRCRKCKLEMDGQFKWCIQCGGDWL